MRLCAAVRAGIGMGGEGVRWGRVYGDSGAGLGDGVGW